MGTLDYVKAAIELAKKAQQVEIAEQLMEVREELLSLREDNHKLREENAGLSKRLKLSTEMKFDRGAYWTHSDATKDGPFCPRCWDVDGKQVRLARKERFHPSCPQCKNYVENV
jgi:hypothetical protein